MITCPICLKKYQILYCHISRTHKISTADFILKYPNSPLITDELQFSLKQNKKIGRKPGYTMSEEQKNKISKATKGDKNPFYNKKHTFETREKMKKNHADFKGDKNPFRKACNKNPDYRIELSKRSKENWEKIKNNPIRYSEVCNKLSVNVAKAYHDGKLSSIGRGHKNGWYKSDKFLKSFYYRSSYELKFLEICENLNTITDCKGCNITIPYISKTGTNKNYIPDFFINNKWIIEIKPLKLKNYENNALKSEAGMAYAKNLDMNYIVLTEECLNYDYIKSVCNQSK